MPLEVELIGGPHDGARVVPHPGCSVIYVRGKPAEDGSVPVAVYWREVGRALFRAAWTQRGEATADQPNSR